jgi:hypothetical protein
MRRFWGYRTINSSSEAPQNHALTTRDRLLACEQASRNTGAGARYAREGNVSRELDDISMRDSRAYDMTKCLSSASTSLNSQPYDSRHHISLAHASTTQITSPSTSLRLPLHSPTTPYTPQHASLSWHSEIATANPGSSYHTPSRTARYGRPLGGGAPASISESEMREAAGRAAEERRKRERLRGKPKARAREARREVSRKAGGI